MIKKNEIKNGFNLIQNDGHVITLCVSAIIIIKEDYRDVVGKQKLGSGRVWV